MSLAAFLLVPVTLVPVILVPVILGPLQVDRGAVEITEAQSASYNAHFESLDENSVHLLREAAHVKVAASTLLELRFVNNPRQHDAQSQFSLELTDGSRVACSTIKSAGQNLIVRIAKRLVSIPVEHVLTLRFRELNDEQQQAWKAISESVVTSDVLAVVQSNGALTKIEGIISKFTPDSVVFEFSDQTVNVPFAKLAGVRFFSPRNTPRPRLKAVLRDTAGNEWIASRMTSASKDTIEVILQCGLKTKVPVSEILTIDFSPGSMRYLANIEAMRRKADSLFDLRVDVPAEADLFGARRVPPVNIPGKAIGPSVEFLGSGQATYLIPTGFSKLLGIVELRPKGDKYTPCHVKILLEGKLRWEQHLAQARQPVEFELAVEADQRLQLVVATDSEFPTGDVVLWQEPRLLR